MFFQKVSFAKDDPENHGEMPEIEAPRRVIARMIPNGMKSFDGVGYFIYQGVKVYETGKAEMAKKRDGLTMEQILHSGHIQRPPQ